MRELTSEQCEAVNGGLSIANQVGFIIGVGTMVVGTATLNPVLIVSGAVGAAASVALD